jgi:hypothetical protein
MKFLKAVLVLLILAMVMPGQSFAWGLTGHRIVAEIAQHYLSKKAKLAIKEIVGNESLAYWANWPDFIKSDTTHTWDKPSVWHYVDLPGNTNKQDFVDSLKKLKGENLYTQIQAMEAQLKNKSLPVETRRNALVFLIHLVGDLHQPLHVGRDEDQGGNKITVYWFDAKTNLHSVWDSKFVDYQQYSYTEYANLLDAKNNAAQVKEWQQSSLEDWFYESHVLSDKVYAQSPAESKLSYKYNYIFQDDLETQLFKGGIRLAKVLNDVLQ